MVIMAMREITISDPNYPNEPPRVIRVGECFHNTENWHWLIDAGFAVWHEC